MSASGSSGPSAGWDVRVEAEQVARVVFGFDRGEPLVLDGAVAAADPGARVLGRAVDVAVRAVDGMGAQPLPQAADPVAFAGQCLGVRDQAERETASAAPDEIPTGTPSIFATKRAVANAVSLPIRTTSSIKPVSTSDRANRVPP